MHRDCDACGPASGTYWGGRLPRGRVQCEPCRGDGAFRTSEKSDAEGFTRMIETRPCTLCGGQGYIRCTKCHGTGSLDWPRE